MMKLNTKLRVVLGVALVVMGAVGAGVPVGAAGKCDGLTAVECAQLGTTETDPNSGTDDLMGTIQLIINLVIFAVGIIAVVMVILGGIQYSTSQGDAGKVKKAKDTIMYGIIGMVVAILAFAIVNFVLGGLTTT